MNERKYKQVVHFVENNIISGNYRIGDKIPSANSFVMRFGISRSSVFLALDELKSRGLIESAPKIGFFVSCDRVKINERILLFFNEFTPFKEDIYSSFMSEIGPDSTVDILFHNYNRTVFEKLLRGTKGKYTSYVLMPGKFTDIEPVLDYLDGHIVLVDHFDRSLIGKYSSVGQDFEIDTYRALLTGLDRIKKYRKVTLIQRSEKEPEERYSGICRFCEENGFEHDFISSINGVSIEPGTLYITAEDHEMVAILKQADGRGLTLGSDFGLISYNDTLVKEILAGGISILSTDFKGMGITVAEMIKDKTVRTVANPCKLTIRSSI